jgi:hypothetical protein
VIVLGVSLCLFLAFAPLPCLAQRIGKGLSFAQIAFGGGYETVINLTNRGTATYSGNLVLRPTDPTRPFPARVNGSPLNAGNAAAITLNPGATLSLSITSGDASLGTVTGFAIVSPAQAQLPYLLEGNLTYYLRSANGTITDSVGVAPSTPTLGTAIPFDDFETVALALANNGPQTTTIRLTVFDDKNAQVGATTQTLAGNQQVPRFLFQFFPGVSLTRGRVEIQSDFPFLGTALTFVEGSQASSLPFLSSMKLYDVAFDIGGFQGSVHLYLTLEGIYAKAYDVEFENGVPAPGAFTNWAGILQDGELVMAEREDSNGVCYVRIPAFSLSKATQSGKAVCVDENLPGTVFQGTITVTAIK